jgi:hypothetical protein
MSLDGYCARTGYAREGGLLSRDDNFVWVLGFWYGAFGRTEGRTADPSTTLPRISCGTWWRWYTSCAFPLQKGAHAALSNAAWQEIRVRFGRDDKGEGSSSIRSRIVDGRTAGPSTTLRSGRDDNSVWVLKAWYGEFGRAEGRTTGPSASPDFLSRVAVSVDCMWFSLGRTT